MRFVKNEWIKLWCQRSTWIMFILTLVGVVAILGLNKYFTNAGGTAEERLAANKEDMAFYEELISNDPNSEYVEKIDCDYYDYLDGKKELFHGEYMSQYSFAEETMGWLIRS